MTNATNATAEAQVRAALASWLTAFNLKDDQAFYALYDPDVIYANEHAPLRRGIDQIKEAFAGAFAEPSSRLSFREEALFASPDLALISGTYHFATIQVDDTLAPGTSGRVALLYRRADDDHWLLTFDIDNSPPDAADYR